MKTRLLLPLLILSACSEAPKLRVIKRDIRLNIPHEHILKREAKINEVDPVFAAAIFNVETGGTYRHDLVSPVGAMGAMQLMPDTIKKLGIRNALNPKESIMGGLRWLYLGKQELLRHGYKPTLYNLARWYNVGINHFKRDKEIGKGYALAVINKMEALKNG